MSFTNGNGNKSNDNATTVNIFDVLAMAMAMTMKLYWMDWQVTLTMTAGLYNEAPVENEFNHGVRR